MNQRTFHHRFEQGQALLLVVLVLVVSMTIGLSVATRSITNVRISSEEQDSQRAFSAAEAGIERALNTSQSATLAQPIQLDDKAQIKELTVASLAGNEILVNNGNIISRGDGVDIWLVPHTTTGVPNYASTWNGNLSIYWGGSTDSCTTSLTTNTMAALEVVTITGTDTAPVTRHYFYDPCATGSPSRQSTNQFTDTLASSSDWSTFRFQTDPITITSGIIVRIIPLYADTRIGVRGSGTALPSQGQIIESVGSSGEAQRKIVTFRGYNKLPTELFPHMLFWPQ